VAGAEPVADPHPVTSEECSHLVQTIVSISDDTNTYLSPPQLYINEGRKNEKKERKKEGRKKEYREKGKKRKKEVRMKGRKKKKEERKEGRK